MFLFNSLKSFLSVNGCEKIFFLSILFFRRPDQTESQHKTLTEVLVEKKKKGHVLELLSERFYTVTETTVRFCKLNCKLLRKVLLYLYNL